MSAMMISALKMPADKIADCGLARPITLSTASCGKTTTNMAGRIAKYFAILPAMFVGVFPQLAVLNVMGLASPQSAILSAVIFNALIIIALIPLSLRGVRYRPAAASVMLRRNLLIYGVGGLIAPFLGIKLIDLFVSLIPGIR